MLTQKPASTSAFWKFCVACGVGVRDHDQLRLQHRNCTVSPGPAGFGHASAVYTLLILISAVTLSFQIVSAKVVAQQASRLRRARLISVFTRAPGRAAFFLDCFWYCRATRFPNTQLPTPILIVWLAVGVTFYVPLGTRRGYLQGAFGFQRLAMNLGLEGLGRLFGSRSPSRWGMEWPA